jgi:hypothetical protein
MFGRKNIDFEVTLKPTNNANPEFLVLTLGSLALQLTKMFVFLILDVLGESSPSLLLLANTWISY